MLNLGYKEYKNCEMIGHGLVDNESLEYLLTLNREEQQEHYTSWKQTYLENLEIFVEKRKELKEKGQVLLETLERDFPTESLTTKGKIKPSLLKIIDSEILELDNKEPKPPILMGDVWSDKAQQKININIYNGSVYQWFDISDFVTKFNEKETKILKENKERLVQSNDIDKCRKYIESKGVSTEELLTEKDFDLKATELKVVELIEKEKKEENGADIKNICSECDYWDGASNRCSCGNRRMYWESEGSFIKNDIFIYPQAD